MAKLLDTYKKSLTEKAYNNFTIDDVDVLDWMSENGIKEYEARLSPKGERKYKIDGKKMNAEEFDRTYGTSTYGASMTLDLITAASLTSSDEEVMDVINKLSSPESMNREEAGELFEETLGYNPTNYYDKRELSCLLDLAEEKSDFKLQEDDHDQILDRAMALYEEGRKSNQLTALRSAVAEFDISDKLTTTISTMIGSMLTDEDDDDYDLDEIDVDIESEDDFDLVDEPEDDDDYDD